LKVRYEIFLAIRYLRTPRRHALAQFTALAAIVGIAFGVAAVIFAQALANGFHQAMQNKILANTAHITVFSIDGADISDWQNLSRQLEQIENVTDVSATSFNNALLIGKTSSSYAVLRGVQIPDSKFQISDSNNEQSKIQNSKPEIAIGKDLAQKTGLQVGDTAEVVSGNGNLAETFAPVSTTVEVGRIFSTGLYEYDSTWIRVDLPTATKLTGKHQITVGAIEVKTINLYNSIQISKLIEEKLGSNFRVLDWHEANRPLFMALSLERRAGILALSLVVFVAALNITTTLALVVGERKSDIAVLKTCGAGARSIILIFLMEGAALGAIGILLGIVFGLAACFVSNYCGLINLPPDVYSISEVSLKPNLSEILLTVTVTFLLCLTASAFPARVAAKVKPMINLQ
jgi:lipoprotein-releasing system permease protein